MLMNEHCPKCNSDLLLILEAPPQTYYKCKNNKCELASSPDTEHLIAKDEGQIELRTLTQCLKQPRYLWGNSNA